MLYQVGLQDATCHGPLGMIPLLDHLQSAGAGIMTQGMPQESPDYLGGKRDKNTMDTCFFVENIIDNMLDTLFYLFSNPYTLRLEVGVPTRLFLVARFWWIAT